LRGEFEGAKLLDIAPTLLDLAGYEIPAAMQGRSLVRKPL
jgi:bisphosphoglycerate-independent phosphoglycerate mutase (AlkP superfamily)